MILDRHQNIYSQISDILSDKLLHAFMNFKDEIMDFDEPKDIKSSGVFLIYLNDVVLLLDHCDKNEFNERIKKYNSVLSSDREYDNEQHDKSLQNFVDIRDQLIERRFKGTEIPKAERCKIFCGDLCILFLKIDNYLDRALWTAIFSRYLHPQSNVFVKEEEEKIENRAHKIENTKSENEQIEVVERDPECIRFLKRPTEAVQLAAVNSDPWSLAILNDNNVKLSHLVKLTAVKNDGDVIRIIENPSPQIKREAVFQNGIAIRYIDKPSFELQKIAFSRAYHAIGYIKNPSFKIKKAAVKCNPFSLLYMRIDETDEFRDLILEGLILFPTILGDLHMLSKKFKQSIIERDNFLLLEEYRSSGTANLQRLELIKTEIIRKLLWLRKYTEDSQDVQKYVDFLLTCGIDWIEVGIMKKSLEADKIAAANRLRQFEN